MDCDVLQCTESVYPSIVYSYENVKSSFTSTFGWKTNPKRIVVVGLNPTIGVVNHGALLTLTEHGEIDCSEREYL